MLICNLRLNILDYQERTINTFYSEGVGFPSFPDVTLCNLYQLQVDEDVHEGLSWNLYK